MSRFLRTIPDNMPRLLILIVVVSALYVAFRAHPGEAERVIVSEKSK